MPTRLPRSLFEEIANRRRSDDAMALINEIRRLHVIEIRTRDLLVQLDAIPTVRNHPTAGLIVMALRDALGEPEPPSA